MNGDRNICIDQIHLIFSMDASAIKIDSKKDLLK